MATKTPGKAAGKANDSKRAGSSAAKTSARSTVSGPSRRDRAPSDAHTAKMAAPAFVEALAKHRHHEREMDPPAV